MSRSPRKRRPRGDDRGAPHPTPAPGRRLGPRAQLALGAAAALAIAGLRLFECAQLPFETGDVVRNLLYGVTLNERGISAASEPLVEISRALAPVSWSALPYNYPPVTLAFFAAVAALSPTVYAVKLALTALEALNACLVARAAQSRALGLWYWASPGSIWWVSREGQFEPLQSTFTLLAVLTAARAPLLAGLALAFAVQTKMTALALAPWLGFAAWRAGALPRTAAGFALGLVPFAAAEIHHHAFANVLLYSHPLSYNPYYWDWSSYLVRWNPGWLVLANALASYGMLAALALLAYRSQSRVAFLAPLVFMLFCKLHTNVQFWYFLLLPALLAPIPRSEHRNALIAACPLLDLWALVELALGPFATPGYRGAPSVFARYTLPGS